MPQNEITPSDSLHKTFDITFDLMHQNDFLWRVLWGVSKTACILLLFTNNDILADLIEKHSNTRNYGLSIVITNDILYTPQLYVQFNTTFPVLEMRNESLHKNEKVTIIKTKIFNLAFQK